MSLRKKLEKLEGRMRPVRRCYKEWPLEDQIEDAVCYLALHAGWGSVSACTDQQLRCIGVWLASEEDPGAQLEDLSPVGLSDFPEEVALQALHKNSPLRPNFCATWNPAHLLALPGFAKTLGQVVGRRLTYDELTGKAVS